MSIVTQSDWLSKRFLVGQQTQVASAASTASAVIRALQDDPNVHISSAVLQEVRQVLSWLDELIALNAEDHLAELVSDELVPDERYAEASLLARAAAPEPRSRAKRVPKCLRDFLGCREGVQITDSVIRVADRDKATELANKLQALSLELVESAYSKDRERASQFAVA